MKNKGMIVFFIMGIMLMAFSSMDVIHAKTITLRYGSTYAANHTYAKADLAFFAKVERESNGRVKFQPYWAGSLISMRESVDDVKNGICDIGNVIPGYSKSGFALQKGMASFFYGFKDYKNLRKAVREIEAKYPEIVGEYGNLKPLRLTSGIVYQLFTSKKAVRSVADLRGMQIKASAIFVKVLTRLGGVGAPVPMFDVYTTMEKGTIDGAFAPYETLKAFRFAEVSKYFTRLNVQATPFYDMVMNRESWNKLPPDVQKIIEDNIGYWEQRYIEQSMAQDQEGIDLAKQNKVEFIDFSEDEMNKLNEVLEAESLLVAKDLDTKGFRATQMFHDIRKVVEKYNK